VSRRVHLHDLTAVGLQHMLDCGADRSGLSLHDWEARQRARVPEPGALRLVARRQWRAALEAARALCDPGGEHAVEVVPVWWGDNDVDVPHQDWRATVALLSPTLERSAFAPDECVQAPVSVRAQATLRRFTLGQVIRTREAAARRLAHTFGPFAAVASPVVEVVSVEAVRPIEHRAAPRAHVPPYSLLVAPATDLDASLRDQLDALVRDHDGMLLEEGDGSR